MPRVLHTVMDARNGRALAEFYRTLLALRFPMQRGTCVR